MSKLIKNKYFNGKSENFEIVKQFASQFVGAKVQQPVAQFQNKSKNKTVVEYALRDISKPIGVSEYKITKKLPKKLKSALPSIEEIEAELNMIKEERENNE